MDVNALYPSLKKEKVASVVYEELLQLQTKGKLIFVDIDYQEVGKYLAVLCSRDELRTLGLLTAVPVRSKGETAPGRPPGPAYWETDWVEERKGGEVRRVEKWVFPKKEPTASEAQDDIQDVQSGGSHGHV